MGDLVCERVVNAAKSTQIHTQQNHPIQLNQLKVQVVVFVFVLGINTILDGKQKKKNHLLFYPGRLADIYARVLISIF
jgi:hypothetical protein